MNYLDEDFFRRPDPEAHMSRAACAPYPPGRTPAVEEAAPLDADALERRFPGLAAKLSSSPGIGFVLARSGNGKAVCFWQGTRCDLSKAEPGPFPGRADLKLVVEGVNGLMQMPSAGDLVIYGARTSFISEHGAHAGPSADEMQTFIIGPPGVELPAHVTHPVHLYDYFAQVLCDAPAGAGLIREPVRASGRPRARP